MFRGKVFAARDVATNLATSLPMGGIGLLAAQLGLTPILVFMGAGMFALALVPSPRPAVRED
jgi:hypothetical protein